MIVRHRTEPGTASPVWLLPVVAPMVSAAPGPLLVPELPEGQWREAPLLACCATFGLSLPAAPAWAVAGARTVRGLLSGALLAAPRKPAPVAAPAA